MITAKQILKDLDPMEVKGWLSRSARAGVGEMHAMRELVMRLAPPVPGIWTDTRDRLQQSVLDGWSAILLGDRGVGKSQLAISLMRPLLTYKRVFGTNHARYCRLSALLEHVRGTYAKGSEETERDVKAAYETCEFLIIDELSEGHATMFRDALITDLLDARYANRLPTVFIANISVKDIYRVLSESVVSRFCESSEVGGGGEVVDATGWPVQRVVATPLPRIRDIQAEVERVEAVRKEQELKDFVTRSNP